MQAWTALALWAARKRANLAIEFVGKEVTICVAFNGTPFKVRVDDTVEEAARQMISEMDDHAASLRGEAEQFMVDP